MPLGAFRRPRAGRVSRRTRKPPTHRVLPHGAVRSARGPPSLQGRTRQLQHEAKDGLPGRVRQRDHRRQSSSRHLPDQIDVRGALRDAARLALHTVVTTG